VLVLGSGVVAWLREHNHTVAEVRNRWHIDLRTPGALDVFDDDGGAPIAYCFFLACEVGGSKFLGEQSQQAAIVESNVAIYQTVLPWLRARNIRFLFTSSYLQHQHTAYGSVKRLGEAWLAALGDAAATGDDTGGGGGGGNSQLGKSVRLFNVYGPEPVGTKSHVITDWVDACIHTGDVRARTDGLEHRQFVHVGG
jgi:nucleoside-diphosphate-sugar epimerase